MFRFFQRKLFYKLNQIQYPEEFKTQIEELSRDYENLMDYILFPQFFYAVIKKYKIISKYLRLVIIDSNDEMIEYLLAILVPYINYLSIITEREYYFSPFIDWTYEETGLTIEIIPFPLKEELRADILIDMKNKDYQTYLFLKKDAIILDMAPSKEKQAYLAQRRKDLKLIFNPKVIKEGEKIDKEQIGYQLWKEYWVIKRLAQRQYIRKLEEKVQLLVLENKLEIQLDEI